ncbi:alkaline phosphatase family protein [Nostocoides vanveenii]|uniref:Phosphoesterase n=1 Tax=Nostocoides vanveenii TaxID=330835 RepID=A0ABN2KWA2_9MICO
MSALTTATAVGDDGNHGRTGPLPGGYKNLVVIYEENHSFDNLLAGWGTVGKDRVGEGAVSQVAQDGRAYGCLLQNDVNLTSPAPLAATCTDAAHGVPASAFTNAPFLIDSIIPATATTCPAEGAFYPNGVLNGQGLPGGCTEDLVHRFYQEQYQINGGRQNRYVTGSDAVGLTMGRYDTTQLPIYRYLHSKGAPNYVIADRFFQAAFGGSFLNHQFLISARAPLDTSAGGLGAKFSVLDANGMVKKYPPLHADPDGRRRRTTDPRVRRPAAQRPGGRLRGVCRQHRPAVLSPCRREWREDPAHR